VDGELVVGLSVAGHLGVLPKALSRFQRKYPRVRVRLTEGFLPMLEGDLKSGKIDLYIGPVLPDWENSDLQASKLFDNERVIVSRLGHPLADKRKLADLSNEYWVTTSITHSAEDELKEIFSQYGMKPPKLGGQGQSALSILSLVLNSDCLAMLPAQWSRSPILGGLLHEFALEEKFKAPPICLVQKTGIGQTPAAEYFCHVVGDIANKIL
jgi:LysR family transcriptional regulator of abg operon